MGRGKSSGLPGGHTGPKIGTRWEAWTVSECWEVGPGLTVSVTRRHGTSQPWSNCGSQTNLRDQELITVNEAECKA